jgi:hypothetical protein
MTLRVNSVQLVAISLAAIGFSSVYCSQSHATLIYWQNFENGDGVADVTPGGGDLGVNATASFAATGGIVGGVLNANVASPVDATPLAATTATGGSAISGLGTLSKFTISLWVNVDSYRTTTGSRDHRLLNIGKSTAPGDIALGANAADSIVFTVRNNASGKLNPKTIDVVLNGSAAAGQTGGNPNGIVGTTTTAGTWAFVALTYDGTSTNANDSADQLAATSGASQVNGQLYFGTSALVATRFDAPFNNDFINHGDSTKPSAGPVNFGSTAKLLLANNATANRGLDGYIDDVRIYDSILTAAEVENVRLESAPVPEPSSLLLAGLGIFTAIGARQRHKHYGVTD